GFIGKHIHIPGTAIALGAVKIKYNFSGALGEIKYSPWPRNILPAITAVFSTRQIAGVTQHTYRMVALADIGVASRWIYTGRKGYIPFFFVKRPSWFIKVIKKSRHAGGELINACRICANLKHIARCRYFAIFIDRLNNSHQSFVILKIKQSADSLGKERAILQIVL